LASSIFRQLEKALETEVNGIREAVLSGVCDDFASYRYEIGRCRGIQFALDTLRETEAAALAADEDF
jgi:hypothetical protein